MVIGASSTAAVHFGADRYIRALVDRLDRYFEAQRRNVDGQQRAFAGPSRGDQALVVGIYGPWGCGKTTWLRRIEAKFGSLEAPPSSRRITVPVFFNAWQFEREPHLVVPMLKTAERAVRQYLDGRAEDEVPESTQRLRTWARESMLMLGDVALALGKGLSGELSTGGMGPEGKGPEAKVRLDLGTSIDSFVARRKERQDAKQALPSPLEAYESLYFDLRSYMRALTGRGERPEAWKWIGDAQKRIQRSEEERQESERRQRQRQEILARREAVVLEIDRLRFWSRRHGALTSELQQLNQALEKLDKEEGSSAHALPQSSDTDTREEAAEGEPEPRLDLLFLIDDLDRCLPEKVVEVLESIKLFLEVPGCAFVLCVDDEIVERGILHRYRDYIGTSPEGAKEGTERQPPVSGAEYLEKLVHLPVRVPPLAETETRAFLQSEYRKLFQVAKRPEVRSPDGERALEEGGPDEAEPEWDETLLHLFERGVPSVPRKLIRAAELLSLLDEVAQDLVANGCFGKVPYERTLLARLVLLQLFAPEVYRLGARRGGDEFVEGLKKLKGVGLEPEIKRLQQALEGYDGTSEKEREDIDHFVQWTKNQEQLRLAKAVLEVSRQRSRFDARKVIDPQEDYDWHPRVACHYRLVEERAPQADAELDPAESLVSEVEEAFEPDALERELQPPAPKRSVARRAPTGSLYDPRSFLAFALSKEPKDWNRALAQADEELRGKVLDAATFESLITEVLRGKNKERINLEWLRAFGRYLDPDATAQLMRETGLLGRLQGTERVDAIEWVCRKFNPPERPSIRAVRLEDLHSEGEPLDLRPETLRWRHLVGLQDSGVRWPSAPDAWVGADARGSGFASASAPTSPPHALSLDLGLSEVLGVCAVGDNRLASAGSDGTVRLWRASDGTLLHTLEGHRGPVGGACAVGDDRLASAGHDGTVRVWRASDGTLLHTLEGHLDWVLDVCAVGDDRL
ncbi:MAG: P-loop NTPase fold protein, partial [Myxococcota bacterium]